MKSKHYEFSIDGAFDCLGEHGTEIGKLETRIDQLQGMITKLSAQLNEKEADKKPEPQTHLLDDIIDAIAEYVGGTYPIVKELKQLRYESIKWAWKDYWKENSVNECLKYEGKEDWIVED